MALERSQTLRTTGKNVTELPLTPEDFFVLSRVDGRATVAEVIASSGLPAATATEILTKLVSLGAIEAAATRPRTRAVTGGAGLGGSNGDSTRDRARKRRAEMLRAQFKQASASESGDAARDRKANGKSAHSSEPEVAAPPEAPAGEEPPTQKPDGTVRVDPVPADDPRLDDSLDIKVEEQRMLLAAQDKLSVLSHFEFLGIDPTNDKKLIRSAYHLVSRRFHPDRYYGKNLGELGPLLQKLFKRAKGSFELLMKDELRESYVERHLESLRREASARNAAAEQEAREKAARERKDAELRALEAQVAQKERAQRDAERRARQQRRIAATHRSKQGDRAKVYYEKGVAEMGAGRPGNAANMFRLALDLEPDNREYESLWKQCLREARVERAAKAFTQASRLEEMGQMVDANKLYVEAAEANPTAEHLAEAAYAVREDDPARARQFAMAALDAMSSADAGGKSLSRPKRGRVHVCAGHAFLAAGQVHSARQQADAAHALVGDRPAVRALLKSLKKA